LLGAFDPLLLGYADRGPVVEARHARRVNAGGDARRALDREMHDVERFLGFTR
jgi:hypothetical protein